MPTRYDGKPEEILALNSFIKFTRAANAMETRLGARGLLGDLTYSQFGVLDTLYHLGSLCQGELSQKLLKSTGNMTLVIDNLEKRGLVRRVRLTEDRRMIRIELTDSGREIFEEIFPRMLAGILDELSVLTPEEQNELGRLAKKLGMGRTNGSPLLKDPEIEARLRKEDAR